MRVGVYVGTQKLVPGFYPPDAGYRQEEALIGRKTVNFNIAFSLVGHFKCIVGNSNAAVIGGVFAQGKRPFYMNSI